MMKKLIEWNGTKNVLLVKLPDSNSIYGLSFMPPRLSETFADKV